MSSEEGYSGKSFAGRWTPEEEAYTDALIHEFRAGTLKDVEEGATLRNFLADAVGCHPKRISKKYEGTEYNGRQQFWRNIQALSPEETEERLEKLEKLRIRFEESRTQSIERATRMKTKKRLRPTFIPPKPMRRPNKSRPTKKKPKAEEEDDTAPTTKHDGSAEDTKSKSETDPSQARRSSLSSTSTTQPGQAYLTDLAAANPMSLSAASSSQTGFMQIGSVQNTGPMNSLVGMGPLGAHSTSALYGSHLFPNAPQGTTLALPPGHMSHPGSNPLLGLAQTSGSQALTSTILSNLDQETLESARAVAEENRKRQLILNALSLAPPPPKRQARDP